MLIAGFTTELFVPSSQGLATLFAGPFSLPSCLNHPSPRVLLQLPHRRRQFATSLGNTVVLSESLL